MTDRADLPPDGADATPESSAADAIETTTPATEPLTPEPTAPEPLTPAPESPAPDSPARERPPPDPALVAAVTRDLALGRRVVALTWLVALLLAGVCLVALREAALLVHADSRLVITSAVQDVEAFAGPLRLMLALVVLVLVAVAARWLTRAIATMEALATAGVVDGGSRGRGGLRRVAVLFQPAGVPADQVTWRDLRVGSGRRLVVATLIVMLVAIGWTIAAVGAASATASVDDARSARYLAAFASGSWIVATILAGAVVADVTWRMAVAARAVGAFAPMSDAPGRVAFRLLPAVLLLVGLGPLVLNAPVGEPLTCGWDQLECGAVEVPVDHTGAAGGSFRVIYGVHRAFGDRAGTLVVAVGGPGASGLDSAAGIVSGFDAQLLGRYDIVFWDQRGIGRSDGHDCPIAGGIFNAVGTDAETARRFVDACLTESGADRTSLQRYATTQAAEDLESIRQQLGIDRFALYGQSYGTELVQAYAAAHPDRLSALILDGAVDLTLSSNDFWSAAARSFERSLEATFDACVDDRSCESQVGDPSATYDELLASLESGDRMIRFGDPDGVVREHPLGRATVESAVAALLYEPAGRMLVQRAVAAAANGDDVPMAKLAALAGPGISPVSTFAYHAILCADYRVSPTAETDDFDAVLANGQKSGALYTRTDQIYLAQVPCLYWPDQPPTSDRPAAITDLPAPIMVLGATLDPITPVELGRSIAERAADGYRIETSGGPHVTFGRGNPCVDEPVVRLLVSGTPPANRSISCSGAVAEPYIPVGSVDVDDFTDALDAVVTIQNEVLTEPRVLFWNGSGSVTAGCRFGGTLRVSLGFAGEKVVFNDCEMADGMVFSGTGDYDFASGRVALDITFDGGSLTYASGPDGSLTGTFRGRSVDGGD